MSEQSRHARAALAGVPARVLARATEAAKKIEARVGRAFEGALEAGMTEGERNALAVVLDAVANGGEGRREDGIAQSVVDQSAVNGGRVDERMASLIHVSSVLQQENCHRPPFPSRGVSSFSHLLVLVRVSVFASLAPRLFTRCGRTRLTC